MYSMITFLLLIVSIYCMPPGAIDNNVDKEQLLKTLQDLHFDVWDTEGGWKWDCPDCKFPQLDTLLTTMDTMINNTKKADPGTKDGQQQLEQIDKQLPDLKEKIKQGLKEGATTMANVNKDRLSKISGYTHSVETNMKKVEELVGRASVDKLAQLSTKRLDNMYSQLYTDNALVENIIKFLEEK
ncbi:uncharacterized protein LOC128952456 [Oppia nitens]|uniref:uncharacterized protein LOC128952456 n=1 Tax=Oppia nitens TaxID=1686743 RepID=UPI0023DCA07D|nr:uncharacterized protein LOC128952456 [Oppia nitens]